MAEVSVVPVPIEVAVTFAIVELAPVNVIAEPVHTFAGVAVTDEIAGKEFTTTVAELINLHAPSDAVNVYT